LVSHAAATWQVDVYEGLLDGVVLAEIELTDADQKLTLPDWIGAEVTSDPRYRKINMVAARVTKLRSVELYQEHYRNALRAAFPQRQNGE